MKHRAGPYPEKAGRRSGHPVSSAEQLATAPLSSEYKVPFGSLSGLAIVPLQLLSMSFLKTCCHSFKTSRSNLTQGSGPSPRVTCMGASFLRPFPSSWESLLPVPVHSCLRSQVPWQRARAQSVSECPPQLPGPCPGHPGCTAYMRSFKHPVLSGFSSVVSTPGMKEGQPVTHCISKQKPGHNTEEDERPFTSHRARLPCRLRALKLTSSCLCRPLSEASVKFKLRASFPNPFIEPASDVL